jgi:hypothetical protein
LLVFLIFFFEEQKRMIILTACYRDPAAPLFIAYHGGMVTRILQLAKTGVYNNNSLTDEILAEVAASGAGHKRIPIVFGHDLNDRNPKWGDISNLRFEPPFLVGEARMHDELDKAFTSGLYDNWSVGLCKDAGGKWYLHHLAILGEMPPAIKELQEIIKDTFEIAAGDSLMTINFGDVKEHVFMNEEEKKALNDTLTALGERLTAIEEGLGAINKRIDAIEETDSEPAGEPENANASDKTTSDFNDAARKEIAALRQAAVRSDREYLTNALAGKVPKAKIGELIAYADSMMRDDINLADDEANPYRKLANFYKNLPDMAQTGSRNFSDDDDSAKAVKIQPNKV